MSSKTTIYLLCDENFPNNHGIVGAVSNPELIKLWCNLNKEHTQLPIQLNDPELLNRIAKEMRINHNLEKLFT